MAEAKPLVVYFSHTGENYAVGNIATGNTAKVALEIAAQTGADIWEIKEKTAYPTSYDACVALAKKELAAGARPEFVGTAPDLANYDCLYLGYPNWWGDAPMIVYSFLDKAAIGGKTIYPFCTHEGSGLGSTARSLATAYPKSKVEPRGLGLRGKTAQTDAAATKTAVADWLKRLGLAK